MEKVLIARELTKQRLSLTPINLPAELRPSDEEEGYSAQEEVGKQLIASGLGPPVGHKIGCTTPVMQKFLSIKNPCAGIIFQKTVGQNRMQIPASGFIKVGIECEIGVFIKSDIHPQDHSYSVDKLTTHIESVVVAMEIVDDRYRSYAELGVPTLIADNFFNSGCVLGERRKKWQDIELDKVIGTTRINGKVVGKGSGQAVMGHPMNALKWLANNRSRRGLGIKKDEFVLLGSVVETKWLYPGDFAEITVEDLGSVSLVVN